MRYLADPTALTPGLPAWLVLAWVSLVGSYGALEAHRRTSAGTLGLTRPRRYLDALVWRAALVWLASVAARDAAVGGVAVLLGLATARPRLRVTSAALLSAIVFGASHLAQGPRTAAIVVPYGLRDQVVVGLTGTPSVAMAVHLAHDAVGGTIAGRRARRADALGAAA